MKTIMKSSLNRKSSKDRVSRAHFFYWYISDTRKMLFSRVIRTSYKEEKTRFDGNWI